MWSDNKAEEELSRLNALNDENGEGASSINKRFRSPESSNENSKQAKINATAPSLNPSNISNALKDDENTK